MSGNREVELKLLLTGGADPDRAHAVLSSWAAERGGTLGAFASDTHTDRYYDDPRLSVARAGFGLRLRMGGGQMLAALKSSNPADGGLHARFELEEPVADDATAVDPWPPRVREVLEGLCDVSGLTPLITLTVERHTAELAVAGGIFEVALDRVEARQKATKRTVAWEELEVEAKDGAAVAEAVLAELAAGLAEALEGVPHNTPKLTTARERLAQLAAKSVQ